MRPRERSEENKINRWYRIMKKRDEIVCHTRDDKIDQKTTKTMKDDIKGSETRTKKKQK